MSRQPIQAAGRVGLGRPAARPGGRHAPGPSVVAHHRPRSPAPEGAHRQLRLSSAARRPGRLPGIMSTAIAPVRSEVAGVEEIRAAFPALARRHRGHPVAYFDGPGDPGPRAVVDAMSDYLYHHNANTHWAFPTSHETDAAIGLARAALADFLNAEPGEVAFGSNMTTLTYPPRPGAGAALGPGRRDRDHRAGPPRQRRSLAGAGAGSGRGSACGAHGRPRGAHRHGRARARPDSPRAPARHRGGQQRPGHDQRPRDRHRPGPRRGRARLRRRRPCRAPHGGGREKLGCDFLGCSAYKFYGPRVGVLYARRELQEELDVPEAGARSRDRPDRLETGTQNHEGMVGAAAAVDFLASLAPGGTRRERIVTAMTELHRRGDALVSRLWNGLREIPGSPSTAAPRASRERRPSPSPSRARTRPRWRERWRSAPCSLPAETSTP